ncbi:MAG: 50S ribosomal protein L5 [Chloroflexi bacterium]|nr:50S ribosomal protein L5 [Chloroflexota bacterium]
MPRDDRLDPPSVPAGAQEEQPRPARRAPRRAAGKQAPAETAQPAPAETAPAPAPAPEGSAAEAPPRTRRSRSTQPTTTPAEGAKPQPQRGGRRGETAAAPTRPREAGRRGAPDAAPVPFHPGYAPRLRIRYKETVAPALMQEFGYTNVMRVPRIQKVVLNVGVGEAKDNARALEAAQQDLTTIAGQKPVVTKARRSIANFKLREGMPIGVMVTLRGSRMWEFLDRLVNVALPRTRDFRGVSARGFDGRGNFSLGLREQIIFPEVDYNQIDKIRGLQVNVVMNAQSNAEGQRLLELLGMPFAR